MKYVIYILCTLALCLGFFLNHLRLRRKRINRLKQTASLRTAELGGDPFKDRIEFHCTKKR